MHITRSKYARKSLPSLLERFEQKYIPEPNSGCWLWTGMVNPQGYGFISVGGRQRFAHRVSVFLATGVEPAPEEVVCHKCDNPFCVNPGHLFVGSHRDNILDCVAKGRARRADRKGAANPASKLSEVDVISILSDRRSSKELADFYGCTIGAISLIRLGKNWRHIPRGASNDQATSKI